MTGGELIAAPTPVSGVRLSRSRLWDERARPQAPPPEAGRHYTAREQAGGRRLIEVHDHLRTELGRLRELMSEVITAAIGPAAARARLHALALRPVEKPLAGYCRTFCRIVLLHHNREDTDVFPRLREFEPRLGPVVDRLEQEHEALHGLVERIDRTLVAEPLDVSALRGAVDLLTDALLSHLSYEEHELVEPLARLWG
ncbi:hemerythrin domain-containing protein [Amycolatopsis sp. WQ 127309]|uniref:hemerythrin domain-containing protein n=1 Tax=Amycolatopsis sp. WQ 127309 TaxID=2932773 RepID=UPI001FF26378|nr:hemerythrin domain-containing protein [Amycolatopsis sp. WQ 127309]UOZ03366.1 hemerythrin domain-containing protein [Amycolatopsis sp. WQ 127309]